VNKLPRVRQEKKFQEWLEKSGMIHAPVGLRRTFRGAFMWGMIAGLDEALMRFRKSRKTKARP
jgi:hypothetical protein